MAIVEMLMPSMGESILECTVLSILKKEGDKVSIDDSILEVATDKVDTEVPCPYSGVISEWLVKVDEVVAIGSPVARIEVHEEVKVALQELVTEGAMEYEEVSEEEIAEQLENEIHSNVLSVSSQKKAAAQYQNENTFYSPLVLSIAREEHISNEELATIQGTGAEERITKNDILAYLKRRHTVSTPGHDNAIQPDTARINTSQSVATPLVSTQSLNGENEVIEMDRMRKMIAQRMVESRRISAHVTSFIETDMTPVVSWREHVKNEYRKKSGDSITFTPILIEAVVKAIKDYPLINISVEGDKIIKKKDINIGMAVALPDGNLIVPVIHRADQYDLPGLARKVNDLARRARENKLKADDLAGGTYTVSNIGAFGNVMGTPIIVQPQVAIMAFGAIKKKPAVVETPQGDLIGIRNMMFISHSYDHRVVDGSLGGLFLKKVHDYLENFDITRTLI